MRALPTRRRVVPTTLMAFGAVLVVLGSFGFTPMTSADEGNSGEVPVTIDTSSGNTTTTHVTTTTICEETTTTVPETTTTVPETTTTVAETTTTTVPKTTTTVPKTTTTDATTTTVAETTTTAPATTTTAKVEVLPTTTIKYRSVTTPTALAVTGSTSIPMVGLGVALFVIGLVLFEIRAARSR